MYRNGLHPSGNTHTVLLPALPSFAMSKTAVTIFPIFRR